MKNRYMLDNAETEQINGGDINTAFLRKTLPKRTILEDGSIVYKEKNITVRKYKDGFRFYSAVFE